MNKTCKMDMAFTETCIMTCINFCTATCTASRDRHRQRTGHCQRASGNEGLPEVPGAHAQVLEDPAEEVGEAEDFPGLLLPVLHGFRGGCVFGGDPQAPEDSESY
ncbi:hypothetical protein CEXT_216971 [Caerostris extrusa]|uniref:Uncharacterized protein n=1 Tax=Caerostris extrusa TaxID=172846 RepID=A0AAV4N035_CAEEX|nr:hypothetical protein CEXT_216971 [Caerostris extrusa]